MKKYLLLLISFLPSAVSAQGQGIEIKIQDPLQSKFTNVESLIATFVDWVIQLGIIASVLAFVYVGFKFVASRGNPDEIAKTRSAFMWTVIGTLVLIAAKVLTEVLKNTLISGGVITAE